MQNYFKKGEVSPDHIVGIMPLNKRTATDYLETASYLSDPSNKGNEPELPKIIPVDKYKEQHHIKGEMVTLYVPYMNEEDVREFLSTEVAKYSEDQPRDEHGQWTVEGVAGLDSLPHEDILTAPGTKPIPQGTIRLYHYTGGEGMTAVRENLASIRDNGILQSKAKGETYGEPNQVWGSTEVPNQNIKHFAEFYVKPDEIGIGRPSGTWDNGQQQPLTQAQIDEFN